VKHTSSQKRNPIRPHFLARLTTMGRGVAHDFNNLLTSIAGNTMVLRKRLTGNDAALENIELIEDCTQRAVVLARRILTFTGQAPFSPAPLDLSDLVRGMRDRLEAVHGTKIETHYDLAGDMPPIPGDAGQIEQLLLALVSNAADALLERDGRMAIETGTMSCDAAYLRLVSLETEPSQGTYAYLQVSDNGRGIPRRMQKLVFDPFFTTKLRGQGLGLCVVIGVLRAHGGALDFWSRANRGSTFKALFPVAGT
jgi:signal transduction histidine kinase